MRIVVAILLAVVLAAAKPTGTATLTAPAQVQLGETFSVVAAGLEPGGWYYVNEGNPGCCLSFNRRADAAGSFTVTRTATRTGLWVYRIGYDDNHQRLVRLAQVYVEVVP